MRMTTPLPMQANFTALHCEYTDDGAPVATGPHRGDGTGSCTVITAAGEARFMVLYVDLTGDQEADIPPHTPQDASCVFQVFVAGWTASFDEVECVGWCWFRGGEWTAGRVLDGMWASSTETSFGDSVIILAATTVPSARLPDSADPSNTQATA